MKNGKEDLIKEIKKEDFKLEIAIGIEELIYDKKLLVLHIIGKDDTKAYEEIFNECKNALSSGIDKKKLNYSIRPKFKGNDPVLANIYAYNVYMWYYSFVEATFLSWPDSKDGFAIGMINNIYTARLALASGLSYAEVDKRYQESKRYHRS